MEHCKERILNENVKKLFKEDKRMSNNEFSDRRLKILIVLAVVLIGWLWAVSSHAQSAPADLSPGLQEVIKLTKAHMTDDVILAYVRNSGAAYTLSANDILYLNSQGVSQSVISALIQAKPSVAAPVPAPTLAAGTPPAMQPPAYVPAPMVNPPGEPGGPAEPPPGLPESAVAPLPGSEVTLPYFQAQLTPYGTWTDIPGYGQCWIPSAQATEPDWHPYLNGGHWEYTEQGWYWQSDYPWGDYVFHYGRWTRDPRFGWAWAPGYHWGPAWVCWRNAEDAGYCGWAPLPPGARFEVGVGLIWNGRVAVDTDFGLGPDLFVFVPFDHFWAHDYRAFLAPSWRGGVLFRGSILANHYAFVGGHFFVGGIGRDRIGVLTHHDVPLGRIDLRDSRVAHDREIQHDRAVDVGRGRGGREGEHRGF
jgi:hypothetical protein